MKMKRKTLRGLLSLVVLIVLVTTACTLSPSTKHQDPSIPWQEQALLLAFGDRSGSTEVYPGYLSLISTILTNQIGVIAPGIQTIHAGVKSDNGSRNGEKREKITYEFQAGGRYVLWGQVQLYALANAPTFLKILPLDEFRSEWEAKERGRLGKNKSVEELDALFQKKVLDLFVNAEKALNGM
jgi:hypothetical protein